ncbi:MAG: hypothetical protein MJZ26_01650 [Fibrobacter sp.]|nr:hypothetical protein [Fibrobacter sp.]
MRKFAFIPFVKVVACAASLLAVQSFAQPRDLFAEFEEEAAAADVAAEKAAAEKKAAEEKAAADKAAAEKKAAEEKAAADKAAAEKKAAEEKAAADKAAAEKKAAEEKAAADKAAEEQAAAEKAAEEEQRAAAERAAAEKRAAMERFANESQQAQVPENGEPVRPPVDSTQLDSMSAEESYQEAMRAYSKAAEEQEDLAAIARDSAAIAQMVADSIAQAQEQARQDSIAMAASSSSATDVPSSSSISRRDVLGPVKVSKVNGIDEMKGRYKNPRKALFMSLVVPGSGQLYVGGSTFTNVRGGVYLALEAALWGGWYYFSVHKYNDQVDKYKDFARKHYSIGRYEQAMRELFNADAVNYEAEFRNRYLGTRESFCEAIYGDARSRGCFDRSKLYNNDEGFINDFVRKPQELGKEEKEVHFKDADEVYSFLANNAYVLGWDDVTDATLVTNLGLEDPNSKTEILGKSDNRSEYRSLRSKANDYADMQAWFFGGLILNHIVSAVDAALTANSHNKALYQEDLSWYDHLHFDSGVNLFNGFGVNVQASWGF